MSKVLTTALNKYLMLPYLQFLDGGKDVKVHVNFQGSIGTGNLWEGNASRLNVHFNSLFVYLKPNRCNRDLSVFQTVVPFQAHKVGGIDPIISL